MNESRKDNTVKTKRSTVSFRGEYARRSYDGTNIWQIVSYGPVPRSRVRDVNKYNINDIMMCVTGWMKERQRQRCARRNWVPRDWTQG